MTIFDGGRESWEACDPAAAHDHRVGSVIAAALAVLVLAALLSGCVCERVQPIGPTVCEGR